MTLEMACKSQKVFPPGRAAPGQRHTDGTRCGGGGGAGLHHTHRYPTSLTTVTSHERRWDTLLAVACSIHSSRCHARNTKVVSSYGGDGK